MEIAIGDNLLIYPWIRTLVRINKSFVVQRSVSLRQRLESSLLMSRYMHYVVREKHDNLWIAQREGRAKDSDDRTQEAVLKMLAMGGSGKTPVEQLAELNIVPLTISYEYDPCDVLKAVEFQQKRDNPAFRKSPADDLNNMQTGIFGYKGTVKYVAAPCINTWIEAYAALPKAEFFEAVARRMDREIHLRYNLCPVNYAAVDLLEGAAALPRTIHTTSGRSLNIICTKKSERPTLPARIPDSCLTPCCACMPIRFIIIYRRMSRRCRAA